MMMTTRRFSLGLLGLFVFFSTLGSALAEEKPTAVSASDARQIAAQSMLADIQQATWIRDGKSAHVIYVFFDPNCPYCHKVYQMLRTQVKQGTVELRWVPIGKLMATSLGKAAAMLEDKDPTAALARNEKGFSQETGSFGGVEEEPLPREKTLQQLQANHSLLKRTGNDAVPTLLFKTKDGMTNLIVGAPPAATLDKIIAALQ